MKTKTHRAPVIGISASVLTVETGGFIGRERVFIGRDYVHAVAQAGGIPILLPIVEDENLIRQQIDLLDGLLLPGGQDVHPLIYGEEPESRLETICYERDCFEMQLAKLAHEAQKPILGICRGLQLMNVAFGGTLHQDIHADLPHAVQHHQKAKIDVAIHTVDLVDKTLLQRALEQSQIQTNSYHHQAVKIVAPGFIVNARTKDGVIEGIEKETSSFTVGVQWHPELMVTKHVIMLKLFQAFINAALQHKEMSER